MHAAHFLEALTIILVVAAVTTVLFQKMHQPVVLGYLAAGFIVGPHVSVPLWADQSVVQTLSELGVILLFFSLGLEFSLKKLGNVGATAVITAVIECSMMIWLGYSVGQLLGWTSHESLFAGAIVAISSTTIIAKTFEEQGVTGTVRDRVVGVLLVEDLIAILLVTVLTAVSSGRGLSGGALAETLVKLSTFVIGTLAVGLLLVPPAFRAVLRLKRPETTLVASIGLCFGLSVLALKAGYSVALGAFVAGSLIAESGKEKEVAHLIEPVRDMFGAIFFVSVGMLINPKLIVAHWSEVLLITSVVVVGKVVGVSIGSFLTGSGVRVAVQSGMTQAQIGEFSFIIAALGLELGATGNFLYPVAVAVSSITTLTTPMLVKFSGPAAAWFDRKLPHRLQTFATLYGSWLEQLRAAPPRTSTAATIRRQVRLLIFDGLCIGLIIIAAAMTIDPLSDFLSRWLDLPVSISHALVIGGAAALAVPFAVGITRIARRLGRFLAIMALPAARAGGLDLAAAPRRTLVLALQLLIVLALGVPLVALTQPFLPLSSGAAILVAVLIVMAVAFWRSATDLEGHVRAGAEVVVEALVARSRRPPTETEEAQPLAEVRALLPGLGDMEAIRLEESCPAIGKTLAELNLRGLTGATVMAIARPEGALVPTAQELLRHDDVLAVTGSREAIAAARQLLTTCPPVEPLDPATTPETTAAD